MNTKTERLLAILEGDEAADVVDNVRAIADELRRLRDECDALREAACVLLNEADPIFIDNEAYNVAFGKLSKLAGFQKWAKKHSGAV